VESDAPYYGVTIHPAVPSGHRVGFAVEWQAAEGAGTTESFWLDVGAPTCESTAATDVPQAILDYQTTTSQISVATAVEIVDIRVAVNIKHTYIGDLRLVLTSPEGTQVVLHDRSGGSTSDIIGTYGVDLTPAEPLSVLAGESPVGTWTLAVSDLAGGDTGMLNAWSVEPCGYPNDVVLHDLTVVPEGVLLTWDPHPGALSYLVYRSTDLSSPGSFIDVTGEDPDPTDTSFTDTSPDPVLFWLVTAESGS
jgi:subtilisin-like proprotein convertase family protein